MKMKLSVVAVLTLTSQLTLADTAAEASAAEAEQLPGQAQEDTIATASQIKRLEKDLTPNLDTMLEEQMAFDLEPEIKVRIRLGVADAN